MDDATILAELSPAPELGTPEATPAETPAAPEEGAAAAAAESGAGGETPSAASEGDGLNLAKLAELAAERRAARGQEPAQPAPQPPGLTAEAIAEAMAAKDGFRQEAITAAKAGDLEALARLTGEKDPATLYERFTKQAMSPGSVSTEQKMAALEAKIAELEGRGPGDDVLTTEKYQNIQREQAEAANREAFSKSVANEAKYPMLSKIDAGAALRYGGLAEKQLIEAGYPLSLDSISRIAEEIAATELGGLLAQQQGAAGGTDAGSTSRAAADSANSGGNNAGAAIDNRAASSTAAAKPDLDDDEAWEHHLTEVARASLTP